METALAAYSAVNNGQYPPNLTRSPPPRTAGRTSTRFWLRGTTRSRPTAKAMFWSPSRKEKRVQTARTRQLRIRMRRTMTPSSSAPDRCMVPTSARGRDRTDTEERELTNRLTNRLRGRDRHRRVVGGVPEGRR